MTKLLHSLPWTLALGLAAQAGEPEQEMRAQTENVTVQESVDESARSEIRLFEAPEISDAAAEAGFEQS